MADDNALAVNGESLDNAEPNTANAGRTSYIPQFSAATEMILQRLRNAGGPLAPNSQFSLGSLSPSGGSLPPGFEDVKRSMMENMKTSLNMDVVSSPAASGSVSSASRKTAKSPAKRAVSKPSTSTSGLATAKGKSTKGKSRAGGKRKRTKDDSESAESDGEMSGLGDDSDSDAGSVTLLPTKTLSGRKIVKPSQYNPAAVEGTPRKRASVHYSKKTGKNIDQALCKRCSRGNSPATNMIVFCDACNTGWHQLCHDPRISDEVTKDEQARWDCKDCLAKKAARSQKASQSSSKASSTAAKAPVKPANWSAMTSDEKHVHFSGMPVQHLVAFMVHATTLHPNLPMSLLQPGTVSNLQFPRPIGAQPPQSNASHALNSASTGPGQKSQVPSASTAPVPDLFATAVTNPRAPTNSARKLQPTTGHPPLVFSNSFQHDPSSLFNPSRDYHAPLPTPTPLPLPTLALEQDLFDDEREASRESTPASPPYPKAGTGMMARLKPDAEDLNWLLGGDVEDAAFSHVLIENDGSFKPVKDRDQLKT